MRFFGIPVSGMLYYVNWRLTNAQLELIAADVSVVDYSYGTKKKKKRDKRKGEYDNTKADMSEVMKAREEWLSRYGGSEESEESEDHTKKRGNGAIAISDVFAGKLG